MTKCAKPISVVKRQTQHNAKLSRSTEKGVDNNDRQATVGDQQMTLLVGPPSEMRQL